MRFGDYSQEVTTEQLDAALRAGAFEAVTHYLSGANARRLESPGVVAGIRAKGWPQAGIDVPLLSTIDGAYAASRARLYGLPPGAVLFCDVEPDEYRSAPDAWALSCPVWCREVRAGGYRAGGYGTDDCLAACFSEADVIWRAKPGMCDPAGPGLADDFFAGRRAVQCGTETAAGVDFDVSYSQYDIGGTMALSDGLRTGLAHLVFQAGYRREPTAQELADLANTINSDGSNFGDLVQGLAGLQSNPDVHRLLNTTLAERLDQVGPAVLVPHHHQEGPSGPAIPDPSS